MYALYRKETNFPGFIKVSYFNRNNFIRPKSFKPVDIDGYRYRMNLRTGEFCTYSSKDCLGTLQCSVSRTAILLNALLQCNDFEWFVTLTFDSNRGVDRTSNRDCYKCLKKFIDNLNHKFLNLHYVCVSELHHDNASYHYHLLVGGLTPKQMGFVNSDKVCCSWSTKYDQKLKMRVKIDSCSSKYFEDTKNNHELTLTDGLPIYNVTEFKFGLSTATKIANKQACKYYVQKYISKALGSTEIFQKRFCYSKNLVIPNIVRTLIKDDLKQPADLGNLESLPDCIFDPWLKASIEFKEQVANYYNEKYNVLQFKFDKQLANAIESAPVGTELINDTAQIFIEQIKIGDIF